MAPAEAVAAAAMMPGSTDAQATEAGKQECLVDEAQSGDGVAAAAAEKTAASAAAPFVQPAAVPEPAFVASADRLRKPGRSAGFR